LGHTSKNYFTLATNCFREKWEREKDKNCQTLSISYDPKTKFLAVCDQLFGIHPLRNFQPGLPDGIFSYQKSRFVYF
jgi:hypothetical protein